MLCHVASLPHGMGGEVRCVGHVETWKQRVHVKRCAEGDCIGNANLSIRLKCGYEVLLCSGL